MIPDQAEERTHIVPPALAGSRLDACVTALVAEVSRSAARRLIDDECVLLDGRAVKASTTVAAGQRIDVSIPAVEPIHIKPQEIPLDIAYEDDNVIVVNKPPGMAVHPGPGHPDGTLVNALAAHCGKLSAAGGAHRPGLVHRLDLYTSGLILCATNDRVHRELSAAIERREVKRLYEALVWEGPPQPAGRLTTRYGRRPEHRTLMAVLQEGGRKAITDYRVAERYGWRWTPPGERERAREACCVVCGLQTGRTHQVRVHMQHLGAPLIGDPEYGDLQRDAGGPEELDALVAELPGQALHAVQIEFLHPVNGETIRLNAAPPPQFAAVRDWLREHGHAPA